MKKGKIFFNETDDALPPFFFALFVRMKAKTRVIGMIARVLVNFTVTAEDKMPSTP